MSADDEPAGDEGDPLEELYLDKEEFERGRLRDALKSAVEIDRETGDPIFRERYEERSNERKFVTLLLYRAALELLGLIDDGERPATATFFAAFMPVSESSVQRYARNLDFVERDDGYYLSGYGINRAIQYLEDG